MAASKNKTKADLQEDITMLQGDIIDLNYRLEQVGGLPIQIERNSHNIGYKQALEDIQTVARLTTPEGSLQWDYLITIIAALNCHYQECLLLWEIGNNPKQPVPDIALHKSRH